MVFKHITPFSAPPIVPFACDALWGRFLSWRRSGRSLLDYFRRSSCNAVEVVSGSLLMTMDSDLTNKLTE